VSWTHDALVEDANVHEQFVESDVLLRVGANKIVKLETCNREHRLVIKLRVVETVQEVNPARA